MTHQKSLIPSHFHDFHETLRLLNLKIVNGWSCNELHRDQHVVTMVNPSTLEDNCGSDLLRTSTWPQLREKHHVFTSKSLEKRFAETYSFIYVG